MGVRKRRRTPVGRSLFSDSCSPHFIMATTASEQSTGAEIHDLEIRKGLEGLTPARIAMLYRRAPLLRPVGDLEQVWTMFEQSSLVLTAWHGGTLVGIARVLTDGVLYSFFCDLAVEPDVQRLGVGKALTQEVLRRCEGTELVVRDSLISMGFYEHMGFKRVDNAWMRKA